MRLGGYETLVDLGRGGMANLFVARPAGGSSLVFVKTLRPPATVKRVEMFLDEARIGLLFDHPNVVRTFDVGEDNGVRFIALELLDGQSVDRLVQQIRKKALDDEHRRTILSWILAEALAGLHYAHELTGDGAPLHIVHRDVTPHNLFVTYDGRVKALDFGIAKAVGRISQTTTGEVKGKVRFMAPEQALGLRTDRRADIFAAGVILFEIASGAPLWPVEMPDRDVFDALVGGDYPVRIPSVDAGSSEAIPGMNAILTRALARDASERYATAAEMQRDLLAELARRSDVGALAGHATELMRELFGDQRERTARMIEHALAEATKAPPPTPTHPVPPTHVAAERASTIKRLLARFGLT